MLEAADLFAAARRPTPPPIAAPIAPRYAVGQVWRHAGGGREVVSVDADRREVPASPFVRRGQRLVPLVKIERARGEDLETCGAIELEPGRDYVVSIDRDRFSYRKAAPEPKRVERWLDRRTARLAAVVAIYATAVAVIVVPREWVSVPVGLLAFLAARPCIWRQR